MPCPSLILILRAKNRSRRCSGCEVAMTLFLVSWRWLFIWPRDDRYFWLFCQRYDSVFPSVSCTLVRDDGWAALPLALPSFRSDDQIVITVLRLIRRLESLLRHLYLDTF